MWVSGWMWVRGAWVNVGGGMLVDFGMKVEGGGGRGCRWVDV